jgi:3-deoxy-D-manno-octulosonate 8-phosphate phosphatase (KDO 8-P phosphatase)
MPSSDLRSLAIHYEKKLKKIKACLFDVDGVLTDGKIRFDGEEMGFNRSTHTSDGYGLKVLRQAGLKVGVISGGNSIGVEKRFRDNLKLDFIFLGNEDKREAYQAILDKGYKDEEILYMGDEFFDLPLLKRCGFSATVPGASLEVQENVDYVTTRSGGEGAAREVIDMLRYAQKIVPKVLDFDGNELTF